jgi:LmbE family N-acetylglucosaminyl deacetylase
VHDMNSESIHSKSAKNVAIIIAHPDDETLWAGGSILNNPDWKCFVICLCRKSDSDRSPRFYKALKILKAEGIMGDLDDGPEQIPLDEKEVENTILNLIPLSQFDIIMTHNPNGEYTKHLRHEEISRAVINLWHFGKIDLKELRTFAYSDSNRKYFPKANKKAPVYLLLSKRIWIKKYKLITEIYGFSRNSWEAKTTPSAESFWQFTESLEAIKWFELLKSKTAF